MQILRVRSWEVYSLCKLFSEVKVTSEKKVQIMEVCSSINLHQANTISDPIIEQCSPEDTSWGPPLSQGGHMLWLLTSWLTFAVFAIYINGTTQSVLFASGFSYSTVYLRNSSVLVHGVIVHSFSSLRGREFTPYFVSKCYWSTARLVCRCVVHSAFALLWQSLVTAETV